MIAPHDLFSSKLAHVHRRTKANFLSDLVAGVVMAGLLLTELDWLPVLAWLAFMMVAMGYHCWWGQRLVSSGFRLVSGARFPPLIFMSALAGAGWGASAFFLPFVSLHLQVLIVMSAMTVAVFTMPRMAALPMMFNAFMAALFLPLLAALLMSGVGQWKMAAIVLLVWGGVFLDSRRVHADLVELYCDRQCLLNEAVIDKLTRLPNRRSFDAALESEWRRAQRFGIPLSVVMIDVDFFKKFNDRYGHQAGDACLARVAGVLADYQRRAGDVVARYGGEEFCMLLASCSRDDACNIVADLCRAVEALAIPHADGISGAVTVSGGGATCIPSRESRAEDLLKAADVALYEAKAGGRNRVCWSAASY